MLSPEQAEARFNKPFAHQNRDELAWLFEKVRGAAAILEIGSSYGHTLRYLASACIPKATICSIDLGTGLGKLTGIDTGSYLHQAIQDLKSEGFDAHLFLGDSKSKEAIDFANVHGPYDFVFIDGDHSYDGAKADWINYGCMSPKIAFHDIVEPRHNIDLLWKEIKKDHKTEECVLSHMGMGLVYRELM